jgi:hypothetical protein
MAVKAVKAVAAPTNPSAVGLLIQVELRMYRRSQRASTHLGSPKRLSRM